MEWVSGDKLDNQDWLYQEEPEVEADTCILCGSYYTPTKTQTDYHCHQCRKVQ